MKRAISLFFLLHIFILTTSASGAELNKWFVQGIEAYHASNYEEAISFFLKIAESKVENSQLYYNLGNAYLKKNNIGNAILWYERALKLSPNDPDIQFNFDFARTLVKDEPGEERNSSVFRILFFWKYIYSSHLIKILSVIFNAVFWGLMIVYRFHRYSWIKISGVFFLLLTIILSTTAFRIFYEDNYQKKGIILDEKISVRSGFDETSTELFTLHSGTKVRIQKESKSHVQIIYSKGKMGWVKREVIGFI